MGYIKKLKNNELVGGTDKHTIYPVTSTKAVFEEVTEGDKSSFKSQETINGEHDGRIKGLENEMPDTVKSITINGGTKKYTVDDEGNVALTVYTVDGDPEMPAIAEAVQSNTENIETLQNTIGGLDAELSSEDSHVSVSVNQSNGLINGLNVTTDDIASAADLAALTSGIEGLRGPNVVITPNHLNVSNPQENTIYREQGANSTYKDWSYADGTWYPMATYDIGNLDPQVSYYTCTTLAATPAKAATGTDASAYALTLGGHFKVEMDEANTATSGVTLQVGSAAAKELMYNGATVNAENTWEAGEVIAVYYYNNKYWASNAQGGGGKAEKIKYDNSQSGLVSNNVQGALDEVSDEYKLFDDTGYNPLGKSMVNAYVASQNWINVTLDNHSITLTTANKQTSAYTQGPVCTILKNGKTYRIEFDYETDFNTNIRTVDTNTVNNVVLKSLSGSGHAIITHTMTYDSGGFTFLIPANTVVGKTISITNFFIYEVSNVKDVLTEVVKENSAFNSDLDSLLFPISEPSVLSFTELGYYINTNTWQWAARSSDTYSKCIKVDPSSRYKIAAETVNKCQITQLIDTTASNGGIPNFAGGGKNGVTIAAGGNIIIDTFSDCEYLYFMMSAYLGFSTPSEVVKREADAEVLLEGEKSLSIVSNRTKPCELAQVGAYGMYINTNTYVWANNANNTSCYVYKVIGGTSVKISTNSTTRVQYTFLTNIDAVAGNLADFADGWNKRIAAMVVDDTVTVDVPNDAKYIYMLSLPPTWGAPKRIDGIVGDGINAVDFVGDSLTATGLSLTSPMAYFPSKVREYLGVDGFNMGVGGENAGTILGRCNGIPYKLASDVTIPADTTQVQIYLTNIYGQHLLPLLQRYTSHTIVIDGIEGTLTTTQTNPAATTANYFFQRKESGSAYSAKAGDDIFVNDFKPTFNPHRAKIIWIGQNGGFDTNSTSRYGGNINNADDRARLIDMIKTYIAVSGCEYYMVLSAPQNTSNDLESDFAKAFGNRYFNVRMYMVNHGIDDAIALGYLSASSYPTAQDITDMNNGVVPSSLRIDNVHFTQNGFYTLAYALSTKLKEVWNL